ncbi:unknown protein [Seminavis robusta]|uniref:Uncharacterized protein n=1 Tax=Seminavis robusta TaxID=568900 RepID=A0A9N8HIU0_9STRA|nr:unknown protein [Seminavis robusta]|eukprot:Sro809_g205551.1  (750) ;mRNA; r:12465-14714
MASYAEIERAFIAVAHKDFVLGEWIPLSYWTHKVCLKLADELPLKISRLRDSLTKMNAVNKPFASSEDQVKYGDIIRIHKTDRRILVGSKLKRIHFLCVETDNTGCEKFSNEKQKQLKFESRYHSYRRRDTFIANHLVIDTTDNDQTKKQPAIVTPTETRSQRNDITHEGNKDVRELLETIFDQGQLPDLLTFDVDLDSFRSKVQAMGIRLQKEANEKRSRMLAEEDDDLSHAVDKSKVEAFLDRFCCPLRRSSIQSFLHVALQINDAGCRDILQLQKYGGSKGRGLNLVPVIPADSATSLVRNAKKYLPGFFGAIVYGDFTRRETCFCLTKLLREYEPEGVKDAVRTTNMQPMPRMNPHNQIAMFQELNLTYEKGKAMRQFFNADKCNPLVSDRVMRSLEAAVNVKPTLLRFQEGKTNKTGWILSVEDVVREEIKSEASPKDSCVHVVLSADHGQGAFRVHVSILFISGKRVRRETHQMVGLINCKKDTRAVIMASGIDKAVNDSLKNLIKSPGALPMEFFVVGDLAFYSLFLGKENMSGHHCWECQMMWKQFQKDPTKIGRMWTLRLMRRRYKKLESKELKRSKPIQEKGIRTLPLFDCIEPVNWLPPPLHGVILLANTPFHYLQRMVWYRHERVPVEVIEARFAKADAEMDAEAKWNELVDAEEHWNDMYGVMTDLVGNPDIQFEDTQHEQDYIRHEEHLNLAKAWLEEADAFQKKAAATLKAKKKLLKKLEDNKRNMAGQHRIFG